MKIIKIGFRDLPGGPVVKKPPCKARDMDLISSSSRETMILHAVEQLNLHVTTTEPTRSGACVPQLESLRTTTKDPMCHNLNLTQPNKYFSKRENRRTNSTINYG